MLSAWKTDSISKNPNGDFAMFFKLNKSLFIWLMLGVLVITSCTSQKDVAINKESGKKTGASKTESAKQEADLVEIKIENYSFGLPEITISAGTKVKWINKDTVAHTVTSEEDKFDSGLFGENKEFSYIFDTPGTYGYFCIPHPKMKAKIIVK
jgi:plastocyanin